MTVASLVGSTVILGYFFFGRGLSLGVFARGTRVCPSRVGSADRSERVLLDGAAIGADEANCRSRKERRVMYRT